MSFMDELRKLTQPYDDEDDFYEGSDETAREQPQASAAQIEFETAFAADEPSGKPEPAPKPRPPKAQGDNGGLFGGFGRKAGAQPTKQRRERMVNFNGNDQQVILFNPKTFDEAGELVTYISAGKSVVMTLEGVQKENARRLLDFLSGITFALDGKITPISAKTYFITPQNVNILGTAAAPDQAESGGEYL